MIECSVRKPGHGFHSHLELHRFSFLAYDLTFNNGKNGKPGIYIFEKWEGRGKVLFFHIVT